MHDLDRREFLSRSAAGLGLAAVGLPRLGPRLTPPAEPVFRISLAQWSLHRQLFGRVKPSLDHLDFAKVARSFGIEGLEYVNQFFKDKATDRGYLTEMKKRADGEGVRSLLIMCDGEGYLGDPDDHKRTKAVENHYRWIEAAKFLGCHSIRVNAQSSGSYEEQIGRAADGLHRLAEFGAQHDLNVIVENHGGLSSNGKWLTAVMEKADHPRLGTLPDFGNFRVSGDESYDRYQGVREMMPYAKAVSAKTYDFDEDGNETTIDYRRMLEIVVDAGYRQWLGIEYEGNRLDEMAGIGATKALLERVRAELDPAK